MNEKSNPENRIRELTERLADHDGMAREAARRELIGIGGEDVTRALVLALSDPRAQPRWEAAKALREVADPVTAPALMVALEDESADVRWVAAEGLVALDKVGLEVVLSGLTKRAGSVEFCRSAHHVLHELKAYHDVCAPVLQALDSLDPAVGAPPAAYEALRRLRQAPDGR